MWKRKDCLRARPERLAVDRCLLVRLHLHALDRLRLHALDRRSEDNVHLAQSAPCRGMTTIGRPRRPVHRATGHVVLISACELALVSSGPIWYLMVKPLLHFRPTGDLLLLLQVLHMRTGVALHHGRAAQRSTQQGLWAQRWTWSRLHTNGQQHGVQCYSAIRYQRWSSLGRQ